MDIREHIKVMAIFDRDVRPVKFRWRGRVYPVKEITFTWRGKDGSVDVMYFSVTDGANLYAIAYNQSTMKWLLEGVEPLRGVEPLQGAEPLQGGEA